MNTAFHVVLLAVVAGASPLAMTAALAVVRSERSRADGIGFAAGFVVGTVVACAVGLVAGAAFVDRVDSHGTIEAIVELLAGGALMVVGAKAARSESPPEKTGRTTAVMRGLRKTGPGAAFSMAALLGFGGPKRLLLTLLAMTSISGAGDGPVTSTSLVIVYVVIATSIAWVPVLFAILARNRAEPILGRVRSWVREHAHVLRVWVSLVLGAVLIVDGLVRLGA